MTTVPNKIALLDSNFQPITSSNPLPVETPGFDIPYYDSLTCTTTGTTTVVEYKDGGSTVATLTVTQPSTGVVQVNRT